MLNMQVKHHKAMWFNGRKYRTKQLDDRRKTCDSGITAIFQVTNISHRGDRHPVTSDLRYYGYLEDILDIDFKSFKVVLFKVRWYRLLLQGDERTVIDHDNGFTMINTNRYEPNTEPYVLPIQCEQVFFSEVPGRAGWSFVVRFDPRGRPVEYTLPEDQDLNDQEEEDAAGEMDEEVCLDEGGNQVDQTVIYPHLDDDDYIDDDLDPDVADVVLENPYNDSEGLDTNFDLHDSDVDLDKVQDESDMDL